MREVQQKTTELLDMVERYSQRKFRYRGEIAVMVELSVSYQQKHMLDNIIFLAKFLWNSYNVMQRIGPSGEGYPKLSAEFQESFEKFSTLVKTLIKEGPEEVKESFKTTFFSMSQDTLSNLIQLASELSWLKNYSIDMKKSLFEK